MRQMIRLRVVNPSPSRSRAGMGPRSSHLDESSRVCLQYPHRTHRGDGAPKGAFSRILLRSFATLLLSWPLPQVASAIVCRILLLPFGQSPLRRVCTLYHLHGRVACRHCSGLWYAAQRTSSTARKYLTKRNIRRKLGDYGQLWAAKYPPKPRGMWRRTYARHCAALERIERKLGY
jgi:hypothetical protein